MGPLEVAEKLKESFPDEVLDVAEFRDQVQVKVRKDRIAEICRFLHDEPDLSFDFPSSLCGVDHMGRDPRFEVVYNLYSTTHRHRILVKAQVPEADPNIDSVTSVWVGVDWHERETYDMFGIAFNGHPDLRRILMPEDWEGHPLRKDYPLKGPEKEWKGYEEVKAKLVEFKEFHWKQ